MKGLVCASLSLFLVHTYHKSSRLYPIFCGSVREGSCVPLGKSLTPQFLGSTFLRRDKTTWILRGVDEMYVQCWGPHQAVRKQLTQESYHHPHHRPYYLKRWAWTLRRKGQRQKRRDRRDGKREERLTVAACWFLGTAPNISRQTEHSVAGEVHGTSAALSIAWGRWGGAGQPLCGTSWGSEDTDCCVCTSWKSASSLPSFVTVSRKVQLTSSCY